MKTGEFAQLFMDATRLKNMKNPDKYEIINEIAKRRGFFWASGEIYGGASGFVTFGPLGSSLKRRIEDKFRGFVLSIPGLYEIESSVIVPGKVFEASGHVDHFKEPMVECNKCRRRFRADHLLQELAKMSETDTDKLGLQDVKAMIDKRAIRCPDCGGEFGEPKEFLTMFATNIGPYSEATGYGRPEAAQGIFIEFKRLYEYARERLPFGVAEIGHALRNEISPRQGPIRLREFTIIDLEFFFDPLEPQCPMLRDLDDEILRLLLVKNRLRGIEEPVVATVKESLSQGYIKAEWEAFFMALAKRFVFKLGVPEDKQRFIEKFDWERAHYSKQGFDQQVYLERWGWTEVSGHNYRTDYDLKRHMEFSGVDMRVFKDYKKPVVTEEVSIKPFMAKLGPAFKGDTAQVVKILSLTDPAVIEESFKKEGFYMAETFKILPDHLEITQEKVEQTGRRFIPHVIEPSFGLDRLFYVTIEYAYRKRENRTLMNFPRDFSPFQVGVYPLMNKDGLSKKADEICQALISDGFLVDYDETGSIGRRYARADEAGTALGVTVDYQTLKDDTVTIRDRDTWKQVRSEISKLPELLHNYFSYKIEFDDLGIAIKNSSM